MKIPELYFIQFYCFVICFGIYFDKPFHINIHIHIYRKSHVIVVYDEGKYYYWLRLLGELIRGGRLFYLYHNVANRMFGYL